MEYRILGKTGLKVSALSFGASSLGNAFRQINKADGLRAVQVSLESGINLLDVSPFYGLTVAETMLGEALVGVPRDKYILCTKCGRYGHEPKDFDFSEKRVLASMDESLKRLRTGHVEILLAHDIEFGDLNQIINETVPAMRKIQKAGKTKFIGISGLPLAAFKRVADAVPVDVVLSYCHYGLNDTSLGDMMPYFKLKGIGVISASPLGMRLLSDAGTPDWHPAPAAVKEACSKAAAFCRDRSASIEKLALQYALANSDISTIMVGSADPENMRRNIAWAGERLDRKLLEDVLAIIKPVHNVTWTSGRAENNV
jgi:aryl-alcohol dehydrogenase-like predicted oxidoreductase